MKLSLASALLALGLLASAADAQVTAGRYSGAHAYGNRGPVAHRTYASSRVWVPGRYATVEERVWVPGCSERVWVEPVYDLALGHCGTRVRVLLSAGHWKTVHHPGHYETRCVRVYRPGHWVARGYAH